MKAKDLNPSIAAAYSVTYRVEVATKSGGINLEALGMIPFVPQPGLMVCVFPGDDYREVEQVYWHCESAACLEVYLKFEEKCISRFMLKHGWHIDKK